MAKKEEFTLTMAQWQQITMVCLAGRANFPKKWGEKEISIDEQLLGREDLGELFKTLRSYSSWLQGLGDDYRALFGDKGAWEPVDKFGKKLEGVSEGDDRIAGYQMADPQKRHTARLGREALSGVVWCCILKLHPHGTMTTSTKEAVDTWWAIAEAIGKATAVRKYVGIAAAKRTDWEDDPEVKPEAGAKEEKSA